MKAVWHAVLLTFSSLSAPSVYDLITQPKPDREEIVCFRNSETKIAGVLCLASDAGPYPVVVYIAGLDLAGRDGYGVVPPHCEELARQGNASRKDEGELLAIHARARRAHLSGDAKLLAADMADTIMEASNGTITTINRAKMAEQFADYFSRAKYSEWDDVVSPVVKVSPDGQMGWMLIQIKAKLKLRDRSNVVRDEAFVSSWIATYEKQQGKWKMVAISSSVKRQ